MRGTSPGLRRLFWPGTMLGRVVSEGLLLRRRRAEAAMFAAG